MHRVSYRWRERDADQALEMVRVEGTNGRPYHFGDGDNFRPIEVNDFYIATTTVTRALWHHVMGPDGLLGRAEPSIPVTDVSWDQIAEPGGFLSKLNKSEIHHRMFADASLPSGVFRLPSETEWEYAARGGPQWRDGFRFSGGNDIGRVAWYDRKDGHHPYPVAQKSPNQLGLYDMSGNVWEWCHDSYTKDLSMIPGDGVPHLAENAERVLRGGCFHNWAIHCTVSKRYQIGRAYHDGCIGFRLVLAAAR